MLTPPGSNRRLVGFVTAVIFYRRRKAREQADLRVKRNSQADVGYVGSSDVAAGVPGGGMVETLLGAERRKPKPGCCGGYWSSSTCCVVYGVLATVGLLCSIAAIILTTIISANLAMDAVREQLFAVHTGIHSVTHSVTRAASCCVCEFKRAAPTVQDGVEDFNTLFFINVDPTALTVGWTYPLTERCVLRPVLNVQWWAG